MKLKRVKDRNFTIPLNSMSDVAFLLLIFIMVIALINFRKEVHIDYATAQTVLNTGAEKNLEVWVDNEGAVYIAGDPASLPVLEQTVADLYVSAPDTRIHILADRNTPYEKINAVLEVLQILQYRTVSFVVKDAE
ncbi:MAG: biopolymer transporter ExbD [Treponema sp.]|jgi:biopolymer transport protein ExbD|nr:biopolymer transporter ExbD [Treponema sp.]